MVRVKRRIPLRISSGDGREYEVEVYVEEKLVQEPSDLPEEKALALMVDKAYFYLTQFLTSVKVLAEKYQKDMSNQSLLNLLESEEGKEAVAYAALYGDSVISSTLGFNQNGRQINPIVENLLDYLYGVLENANTKEAEEAIKMIDTYIALVTGKIGKITFTKKTEKTVIELLLDGNVDTSEFREMAEEVCYDASTPTYRRTNTRRSSSGSFKTKKNVAEKESTTDIELSPRDVGTKKFFLFEDKVVDKIYTALNSIAEFNEDVREIVETKNEKIVKKIIRDSLRAGAIARADNPQSIPLSYGPTVDLSSDLRTGKILSGYLLAEEYYELKRMAEERGFEILKAEPKENAMYVEVLTPREEEWEVLEFFEASKVQRITEVNVEITAEYEYRKKQEFEVALRFENSGYKKYALERLRRDIDDYFKRIGYRKYRVNFAENSEGVKVRVRLEGGLSVGEYQQVLVQFPKVVERSLKRASKEYLEANNKG